MVSENQMEFKVQVNSEDKSTQDRLRKFVEFLANQKEVEWIELAPEFETMNKHATALIQVCINSLSLFDCSCFEKKKRN